MTVRQLLVIASLAAACGAGCASIRGFTASNPKRPASAKDTEIDRFVQSWNQNAQRVDSILVENVDVTGKAEGKPIPLTAKLGFKQPNNFRMTGDSIGGKSEVDLGSNTEEIWFWIARANPPAVYFCKREDFGNVNIAMPFHPDWIVDLLGVSTIDRSKYQPDATTPDYFTLVSTEKTPTGHTVIKRLIVDRETGRLGGIELFDPKRKDTPLMMASIREYYDDPSSGLFLPSKIRMEWPDSNTRLTITLPHRNIQLNSIDQQMASVIFQRRDGDYIGGVETVDIGRAHRTVPASAQRLSDARGGYDPRLQRANGTRLKGVIETN